MLQVIYFIIVALLCYSIGHHDGAAGAENKCRAALREAKEILIESTEALKDTIPVLNDCARR